MTVRDYQRRSCELARMQIWITDRIPVSVRRRRTCRRSSASGVVSSITTVPSVLLEGRTRRRSRTNKQRQKRSIDCPLGWRKTSLCLLTYPRSEMGRFGFVAPDCYRWAGFLRRSTSWISTLLWGPTVFCSRMDQWQWMQLDTRVTDAESSCNQMLGNAMQSWQQCRWHSAESTTTQMP